MLKATILGAFTPVASEDLACALAKFRVRDWNNLGNWLHASGVALYLLGELKLRGIEASLPGDVLQGLVRNHVDNRERTAALAHEFTWLNSQFAAAHLDYLCVKGFSLGPPYCEDVTLRSQFDLDFWMAEDLAAECGALMRRLGYKVTRAQGTLECHTAGSAYPRLRDFYKPPIRRCVEIHLRPRKEFERLERATGVLSGAIYPTLSRERTFIEQALHLAKHLRSEWTRASWILEFWNAVQAQETAPTFWSRMAEGCSDEQKILMGISVAACARVLKGPVPEALRWATATLPAGVAQWIDEYAPQVAMAGFPGTKFYLLLERELSRDRVQFRAQRRAVLLPLRTPGYIAAGGLPSFFRDLVPHVRYGAMRLAFHAREGARLMRAERRWGQQVSKAHTFLAREDGSIA